MTNNYSIFIWIDIKNFSVLWGQIPMTRPSFNFIETCVPEKFIALIPQSSCFILGIV